MNYELRHFDTILMRFTATENSNTPEIEITWTNDDKSDLFPLDLAANSRIISDICTLDSASITFSPE